MLVFLGSICLCKSRDPIWYEYCYGLGIGWWVGCATSCCIIGLIVFGCCYVSFLFFCFISCMYLGHWWLQIPEKICNWVCVVVYDTLILIWIWTQGLGQGYNSELLEISNTNKDITILYPSFFEHLRINEIIIIFILF